MKIIKAENLPAKLTPEIIDVLVEMAREFPKRTFDWAEVSDVLDKRGELNIILDKVQQLEKEEEQERERLKSDAEKQKEADMREKLKSAKPTFIGNMGEPETAEEYKRKYGHYPPGYEG